MTNQIGEIIEIPICKECGSNTGQMGYANRVSADLESNMGTIGLWLCGGCLAIQEGNEVYYLDGKEVGRGDDGAEEYDYYEIDDESYDRDFKDHCEFIDADQPSARAFRKLFELDPIPIFQLVSMLDRYVIPYKEKRKWE